MAFGGAATVSVAGETGQRTGVVVWRCVCLLRRLQRVVRAKEGWRIGLTPTSRTPYFPKANRGPRRGEEMV